MLKPFVAHWRAYTGYLLRMERRGARELSADGWAFVRRLNRDNVGSKRWARKSVESPRRFCRVRLLLGDDRVFDACVKSSRGSHELCKEVYRREINVSCTCGSSFRTRSSQY